MNAISNTISGLTVARTHSALSRAAISAVAFRVAVRLLDHLNKKTGRCFPSVGTLAEAVGKSARTVRRALAELRAAGFISVKRVPLKSNRYTFHFDKILGESPPEQQEPPAPIVRPSVSPPVRPSVAAESSEDKLNPPIVPPEKRPASRTQWCGASLMEFLTSQCAVLNKVDSEDTSGLSRQAKLRRKAQEELRLYRKAVAERFGPVINAGQGGWLSTSRRGRC